MGVQDTHIVVAGAGLGGLAAAALLATKGAPVTVLEAQCYPGGCAATFSANGYRFDAGATVGCGFHSGGPMDELGRELGIEWPVCAEPVAWQYRHGSLRLDLTCSRTEILERFPHSAQFWREQGELSKLLWRLASGGLSWPPSNVRDLAGLVRKALSGMPGATRLVRFATKTAYEWLTEHRLDAEQEFVRFIDAQLLISVQTTSRYANAVNAAIALDLPSSGAWQVRGGMGRVAELLAGKIEESGGAVLYGKKVVRIHSVRNQVVGVEAADGSAYAADLLLANLVPQSLEGLLDSVPGLFASAKGSPPEWSAFMLYLGMDRSVSGSAGARHLQIIGESGDLGEGNSIFVSFSPEDDPGRAPDGLCAVTVSTHTRPKQWFDAYEQGAGAYRELKAACTEKVLALLSSQLPGFRESLRFTRAGTPLTWQRYTGRYLGYVGGYPQRSLFDVRGSATRFDNLFLVGDSIFPGQSLPGVVTGARRVVGLVGRLD